MWFVTWLGIALALIIFEIITVGLTSIWFAAGAFVAAIVSFIGGGLMAQLLAFVIVSVLLLIFTRPIAVKYIFTKKEKTNIDAIVGKQGVVIEKIDNAKNKGVVKLDGLEWSARSTSYEIAEGKVVVVQSISGVKLIVEELKQDDNNNL
ncbi:MAG: NfeD family protein [Lachnospiraceae bacterium]|nr:NfeD family protein [Lachnospiraceae bacterium]